MARDELGLVAADHRGRLLQPQIGLEPAGYHVPVRMPPFGAIGYLGHFQQVGALILVGDTVERAQVGHITRLEAGSAQFQPADLGLRRPDGLARGLTADAGFLPQPAERLPEHQPG